MQSSVCFVCREENRQLFSLPRDEETRERWLRFLFSLYAESLRVCSAHFTEDSFLNKAESEARSSARLVLREGAVPTETGTIVTSASQQTPPQHRHVGCQTDPEPTVRRLAESVSTQSGLERRGSGEASTPSPGLQATKKRRLDLQEEEKENVSEILLPCKSDKSSDASVAQHHKEAKYIVFESCLRGFFQTCPECKQDCEVRRRQLGTFVSFSQLCSSCKYSSRWDSQPIRGSTPLGNIQMSAAIYFTGGAFTQLERILRAMNIQMFQYEMFKKHARMYLDPTVNYKWKTEQRALLGQLREKRRIAVVGDLRTGPPGDPTKLASYTLMHLESNRILDVQLLQGEKVGGGMNMEREGLRRGLDLLEANKLKAACVVTDRRSHVQKLLKERGVPQHYDVWRLEKGLSKKLEALTRNKACLVHRWLPIIKNHIYWTAASSKSGPERVAKWKSLINHVQNIHTHDDPLFPKCAHPDKVSIDHSKWLLPGSLALYKVERVLLNHKVLRDVEKLSHDHQTSCLEAFRRIIRRFTPKNIVFPFVETLCRLYLAAMYFNENGRDQRGKPTTQYVSDLMRLLFEEVFEDPTRFVDELKRVTV
ncbi:uncharacterized protein ACBR49_019177 [Aulostomus maculatus]